MAFSKHLYFLTLLPQNEVLQEVLAMKNEINEKFSAKHALKLPAHVTLLPPFELDLEQEQLLIKFLTEKVLELQKLEVHLKNFGQFKQRILFIDVENKEPVQLIAEKVTSEVQKLLPLLKTQKLYPHITLATRDLDHQNFRSAWKLFSSRTYTNKFCAKSLFLMKHDGKFWEILKEFPFSEG